MKIKGSYQIRFWSFVNYYIRIKNYQPFVIFVVSDQHNNIRQHLMFPTEYLILQTLLIIHDLGQEEELGLQHIFMICLDLALLT